LILQSFEPGETHVHIENMTINVGGGLPIAREVLRTLQAQFSEPVPAAATSALPKIGEPWPGQGGIYAGLARGVDDAPDAHLILAAVEAVGLKWGAALEWAKTVEADGHTDFAAPTRFESALLYANLRDQFDTSAWYWTSTQYSDDDAWGQYFNDGSQGYDDKSYEGRVRAVRRFIA